MTTKVLMRPENWLEFTLATPLQIRLIRLLLADPQKTWTEREAAAALGENPSSVNKVFARLWDLGLLHLRRAGRSHVVRLQTELGVVQDLQQIFRTESSTTPRLAEAVQRTLPRGVSCYLFGSTARGTAKSTSDVDLVVVGPSRDQASQTAARVHASVRRLIPVRVDVIALSTGSLKDPAYRALVESVRLHGRRVGGPIVEALSP